VLAGHCFIKRDELYPTTVTGVNITPYALYGGTVQVNNIGDGVTGAASPLAEGSSVSGSITLLPYQFVVIDCNIF
jgi:hypothetical protein